MAAVTPTKEALLQLYSNSLRTARAYSSYNFREYFVRRTKSQFREIQDEKDPAKLSAFYNERVKELAVIKRGAIVNQLYGGWKLVLENEPPKDQALERSDS
ncbi:hypothetical protein PHLGIDRAFT_19189 [Phlebiopsis gigantea 11061_1 CR5-6]|uniref:Complex 1 LYR protein domain-containing protein n=1 Tax=Phlebiopsis gigantea (strain 11061_1 CR5-6) TaxID=745531 RepID=A0A0C3SAW7_PHLG1|nr:hypothetical protein PHLGIDRAFT_19189 [Phlebiopsis gigantea 11061_1 CR5-6]